VATNAFMQTLVGEGASKEYAQSLVGMFSELARGIARAEPRLPETTTPTTLGKWVSEELLPAVAPQTEAACCCDGGN